MACTIRRVDYFHTTVRDQPGEAYKILTTLEELGINQLAFIAVPIGTDIIQLTIFPEDSHLLLHQAKDAGLVPEAPIGLFWCRAMTNSELWQISTASSMKPISMFRPPAASPTAEAVSVM